MNKIKDPILEGKGIVIPNRELSESKIPDKFSLIDPKVFRVVLAYLKLTWELKNDGGKNIPFVDLIDNTKYLFSAEGKYKDKLWKEHSATNLRELFYDLKCPDDYCRAIKNIGKDEIDPSNDLFSRIIIIKSFLSDVIHYRWSAAQKQTNKLFGKTELSNKSFDEIYEIVCVDLFYTLYRLYKKYAYHDNDKD